MKFRASFIQDQDRIVFESASGRPIDISDEVVGDGGSIHYLRYADVEGDNVDAFIFMLKDGKHIAGLEEDNPIGAFDSHERAIEAILEKL